MSSFAIEYFFFVLISNLGLLSVVAGKSDLKFIKVIQRSKISMAIGICAIATAFGWFFGFGNRNINDLEGGLDANMQAVFFVTATLVAIIISLFFNSVFRMTKSAPNVNKNQSGVKEVTYLESLLQQRKAIHAEALLVINDAIQTVSKIKLSVGLGLVLFLAVGLQIAYLSSSNVADWSNIVHKLNLDSLVTYDEKVALIMNGYVGRSNLIDSIIRVFASDYFFPVVFALFLVGIWFNGLKGEKRAMNQEGVIFSLFSLALANWVVFVINAHLFRPRPFEDYQINLIFYKATDSSFPSNALSVLFAISIAVLIKNRDYGVFLIILSVIYGISRIYVGIHYPLDIISALIFGVIAAGVVYYVGKLIYPIPLSVIKLLRLFFLA